MDILNRVMQWNAIISDMISTYNIDRPEEEQICDIPLAQSMEALASETCMISLDDVGVRHQKEKRKDGGTKQRKFVENTVIHIQADSKAYVITAVGMESAFRLLVAFLLQNHLMEDRHLVFFSDGAQNIRSNITCHAARRSKNLRISSNTSEKANDCLVAQRQKHNGMSWSFEGSGALALLNTVEMNNTLDLWLHEGKLTMSLKLEGREITSIRAA